MFYEFALYVVVTFNLNSFMIFNDIENQTNLGGLNWKRTEISMLYMLMQVGRNKLNPEIHFYLIVNYMTH